jgi:hypothetical protein
VRVEDFCTQIRVKMFELDKQIYSKDQFWHTISCSNTYSNEIITLNIYILTIITFLSMSHNLGVALLQSFLDAFILLSKFQ